MDELSYVPSITSHASIPSAPDEKLGQVTSNAREDKEIKQALEDLRKRLDAIMVILCMLCAINLFSDCSWKSHM